MVVARVKLYATLRRHDSGTPLGSSVEIGLPEGSTIADLIEHLRIPPDTVRLAFVNGSRRESDYLIIDGDDIALFPPIAGGLLGV